MKILVCGDRNWTDKKKIKRKLESLVGSGCPSFMMGSKPERILIHGDCQGADRCAENAGKKLGWGVMPFPADWNRLGKKAGPIRNRQMLDQKPDRVIAFHSNIAASKGTWDCIKEANRRGIPVEIIP